MAGSVVEAQVVAVEAQVAIVAEVAVVTVAEAAVEITAEAVVVEIIAEEAEEPHAAKQPKILNFFRTKLTFKQEDLRNATHAQADQVPQITPRKPRW